MSGTANVTKYAHTFSWPRRLLLGYVAIAGTALYAASFALVEDRENLAPIAQAIGIAAGVSWPVFGLILLLITRCRPGVLVWVDACLVTMSAGIGLLMLSTLLNLGVFVLNFSHGVLMPLHLAILLAADTAMALVFVRRSRSLGLNWAQALVLWVIALNGVFAGVLILLNRFGGGF